MLRYIMHKHQFYAFELDFKILFFGRWTVPGGSVRPGQSGKWLKQASSPNPDVKNQFNIGARQCPACQILS